LAVVTTAKPTTGDEKHQERRERSISRETRPEQIQRVVHNYHHDSQQQKQALKTTSSRQLPPSMAPTPEPEPNGTVAILRDRLMQKDLWDGSPMVIESHKLIFLTTPKVSCTVFKQLFRRMMGYSDWKSQRDTLPHNPAKNGLLYLSDARFRNNLTAVNHMLHSPEWTFAVFVRDPKERMLSAYFDKAKFPWYLQTFCCDKFHLPDTTPGCRNSTYTTTMTRSAEDNKKPVAAKFRMPFDVWLKDLVPICPDHHWTPQYDQLPARLWPTVDFIGHFENLYGDTKALLQRLVSNTTGMTAWEEFGAKGWGTNKAATANNTSNSFSIFDPLGVSTISHGTGAREKVRAIYTPWSEDWVEQYYAADFSYVPFGFSKQRVTGNATADHNSTFAVIE
jgi:hypothetical protein